MAALLRRNICSFLKVLTDMIPPLLVVQQSTQRSLVWCQIQVSVTVTSIHTPFNLALVHYFVLLLERSTSDTKEA